MSARLEEAGRVLARFAAQGLRIARLCADSRRVVPGDLFLAIPGSRSDGRGYAAEAVARGAVAVLREAGGEPVPLPVPVIGVGDLRGLAGPLAHLVYGRPSERMIVVGVTGTNGKTSVSQWIARVFDATGTRCAVIGTLGSGFPGCLEDTANTTPGPIELHASLARLLAAGAGACAMEVSSIGLDQERVAGVAFRCAVFTNLTRDHLEYHGTMQRYGEAKARLFAMPGLKSAVLNLDDPFGRTLAARLAGVRSIGYTLDESRAAGQRECFVARELEARADGLHMSVSSPAGEAVIDSPLLGRFNASNLLAVLAACHACDIPLAAAVRAARTLVPPEGRMQALGGIDRPMAVIDYAHTPDALEQALGALREVARARGGKLAVVFGCGGDRDPGKRPQMGEVAARLADRVILASDNPRCEDPRAILDQIRAGAGPDAIVIEERAQAIRFALAQAQAADVVLIAGKGHESYQEANGERRPFSDAREAREALAVWGVRAA